MAAVPVPSNLRFDPPYPCLEGRVAAFPGQRHQGCMRWHVAHPGTTHLLGTAGGAAHSHQSGDQGGHADRNPQPAGHGIKGSIHACSWHSGDTSFVTIGPARVSSLAVTHHGGRVNAAGTRIFIASSVT